MKVIFGRRKQGKSTLSLALALDRSRIVIFDPNNQFPYIASIPPQALAAWLEKETDAEWRICRVGPIDTEDIDEVFAMVAAALFEADDVAFVVDEAHLLQSAKGINENLDRMIRRSTSTQSLILNTHRVTDAHNNTRYHAVQTFFFSSYLPRELKAVGDNFSPEVAAKLPALPPHHVLVMEVGEGGVPDVSVWDNPEEWFIDLRNKNQ